MSTAVIVTFRVNNIFLEKRTLNNKMSLLVEVASELKAEGTPVIWVFDSFGTLISNALENSATEYKGFISWLFQLHRQFLCLPVCSSATTARELAKSKEYLTLCKTVVLIVLFS